MQELVLDPLCNILPIVSGHCTDKYPEYSSILTRCSHVIYIVTLDKYYQEFIILEVELKL